jgi:murein DD-endopeptidase MepM/ murein hydrolase activator NlpD
VKRSLTVILVPHDRANPRTLQVSYRLLVVAAVLLSLGFLTVTAFVATYGRVYRTAREANRLEKENRVLRTQVARLDTLEAELVGLRALSIQVKRMLGVDLSREDSLWVAQLAEVGEPTARELLENPDAVAREAQRRALAAIPSLWPVRGFVTREYRTTGGEQSDRYHPGIDIAAPTGSPIRASADGVVLTSGWDERYGYLVVIDHGFGLTTLYGHNSRNVVEVGQRVRRGDVIAFLGNTGRSTAPHLHFEVRKNGLPVDPRQYLLR